MVDPEGNLFITKGVNCVGYPGDYAPTLGYNPYKRNVLRKYRSVDAWAEETVNRLRNWGFNTIGAWSNEETFTKGMPYTIIFGIASTAGVRAARRGNIADYFSENFEKVAEELAEKFCAPRRNDNHLIGYFTDNELKWTAHPRFQREVFDDYLILSPDAEGKKALIEYLKKKYGSISSLNESWETAFSSFEEILSIYEAPKSSAVDSDKLGFLEVVSQRYSEVCHNAIKRFDPNHLILGCRYMFKPPDEVLKGCLGYVDVISMSCYTDPHSEDLRSLRNALVNLERIHNVTGLPIMISEFNFRAMDSGLPNTRPPWRAVETQLERANAYEEYVETIVRQPFVVGYHWFQYPDQPAEGRFDGENGNTGLVKIDDEPWSILVAKAKAVNLQAESIHSSGQES